MKINLLDFIWSRTVIAAKYMLDKPLEEFVNQVTLSDPSNIEHIAKTLTIEDESKITSIEVLAYGCVVEALSKAKEKGHLENIIEKWAERARWVNQNPKSIKYMVEMSKEEIQREIDKMEGVMKTEEEEETIVMESKKRRQSENAEKKLSKENMCIDNLSQQVENIDINTENKFEELRSIIQNSKEDSRKDLQEENFKGKKAKKDKEAPIDSILQDVLEIAKPRTQQVKTVQEDETKFIEADDSIEQSI